MAGEGTWHAEVHFPGYLTCRGRLGSVALSINLVLGPVIRLHRLHRVDCVHGVHIRHGVHPTRFVTPGESLHGKAVQHGTQKCMQMKPVHALLRCTCTLRVWIAHLTMVVWCSVVQCGAVCRRRCYQKAMAGWSWTWENARRQGCVSKQTVCGVWRTRSRGPSYLVWCGVV